MSGPSRRRHRLEDSLEDIIANIARIERHVASLSADELSRDELRHDAIERCLERICEAAIRMGDAAAALMPNQPWQDIRGMGNRLRHAYDDVDPGIVWRVISNRPPELKAEVTAALLRLQSGGRH